MPRCCISPFDTTQPTQKLKSCAITKKMPHCHVLTSSCAGVWTEKLILTSALSYLRYTCVRSYKAPGNTGLRSARRTCGCPSKVTMEVVLWWCWECSAALWGAHLQQTHVWCSCGEFLWHIELCWAGTEVTAGHCSGISLQTPDLSETPDLSCFLRSTSSQRHRSSCCVIQRCSTKPVCHCFRLHSVHQRALEKQEALMKSRIPCIKRRKLLFWADGILP